jgi:hypothetical protein
MGRTQPLHALQLEEKFSFINLISKHQREAKNQHFPLSSRKKGKAQKF